MRRCPARVGSRQGDNPQHHNLHPYIARSVLAPLPSDFGGLDRGAELPILGARRSISPMRVSVPCELALAMHILARMNGSWNLFSSEVLRSVPNCVTLFWSAMLCFLQFLRHVFR
jgi:hypothetical protein